MVFVINDLEEFKEHSRSARCKMWRRINTADGFEIRLKAGKLGFKKEFKSEDDPEYKRIRELIEREGFVEVVDTIADDVFFI